MEQNVNDQLVVFFFDVLCYELMKKQMYLFFCDNHKIFSHLEYTLKADFYRGGRKV